MWGNNEKNEVRLNASMEALATENRTRRLSLTVAGALVTVLLWGFHLGFSARLPMLEAILTGRGLMIIFFIPPFVTVYCLGKHLASKPGREPESKGGMMSSYAQMNDSNRDWKIMILAAVAGVVNAFLMMFTTPIK